MCEMCEQLRVQLAGCAVAAQGGISPDQIAETGDYGWSPAYQDVLNLRNRYDDLRQENARLRAALETCDADNQRMKIAMLRSQIPMEGPE